MDSTLILHYFETTNPAGLALLPVQPEALARDLHLLRVISPACEKAVQHVKERTVCGRKEKQHQPWIARVTGQLLGRLPGKRTPPAGGPPALSPRKAGSSGAGHQHAWSGPYPV